MSRMDEDLYGGYSRDGVHDAIATRLGAGDHSFLGGDPADAFGRPSTSSRGISAVPQTAASRRSPAGMRLGTAVVPGSAGRLGTAMGGSNGRPMTSNKGAGYSSSGRSRFDPMQLATQQGNPLGEKDEASPEEQCREAEAKVHAALEESAQALHKKDVSGALDRAKEAVKRERAVIRLREQLDSTDHTNLDLQYAVAVNLAVTYQANQMYTEALNAYTQIIKGKVYPQAGQLRVNMGAIYFEQRKFPAAIKMLRMALDQVPVTNKAKRTAVMRNIGLAFVRMGQYQDALQTYETIMDSTPDPQAGYNLAVCTYAVGDKEKMKSAFLRLIQIPPFVSEEDDVDGSSDADMDTGNDELQRELKTKQTQLHGFILTVARLIAPVIERSSAVAGFDYCIDALNNAGLGSLANEVALAKASWFLDRQEFVEAIRVLKDFEKKEHKLKAQAATNLAFLSHAEGDAAGCHRHAELAVSTDRYSAQALVNKGNAAATQGDVAGAKALYTEAISNEADCVEAIYNLGLLLKQNGEHAEAVGCFTKLHALVPDNAEVMYQLASTYELSGDMRAAIRWFERLNSHLPQDPGVLARLGALHAKLEDDAEALRYYQESHRVYPVDMDVISWLGAFYVKNEVYEKAVPYFDLAAQVQPQEVKWQLMVASCHRRIGNYQQALAKYQSVHNLHPLNVECLRYLVHLCTDMGLKDEVQTYADRLRKAERQQTAQQQQQIPAAVDLEPDVRMPRRQTKLNTDGGLMLPQPDEGPAFQIPASKAKKAQLTVGKEDDEWALGEDLLPL